MSEGGSGTKAMQVCMWPGNEVMSLVCRQADHGIFSTWANSVQCQRLADVFTKLHVSGSSFSVLCIMYISMCTIYREPEFKPCLHGRMLQLIFLFVDVLCTSKCKEQCKSE